eukprot:TRINITY_DN80635_c0_g1_i1.p1 TRINITY_DN80635_c0_g1~~TRINITY_DN80635_c0_g1_i1.p1  ORF type:complete len:272 (+),score=21.30 TRINITY_DN80635_c0_g1_i1:90-905(+)
MKRSYFAIMSLMASLYVGPVLAAGPSAWEDIMSSKQFKVCVTQYPPNSFKDEKGKWAGFSVDMAQDLGKSMNVGVDLVETNWKNVVLDVQSGRCHVILGLSGTPERALAMDFAGPIYSTIFSMAPRRGASLPGSTWTDVNKPELKFSVVMGTAQEMVLDRYAPQATKIALSSVDEAVLAVQAGRADAYMGAVFDLLAAKGKGPVLGDMVVPKPQYSIPSYAGIRYDDGRLAKYIQRWGDYNRSMGKTTGWIVKALEATGIKKADIPTDLDF